MNSDCCVSSTLYEFCSLGVVARWTPPSLQEENSEEEDLLDELASALTVILREYKDAAMPWIDTIMPQIGQLLDATRSPAEQRIGICIIDDLLEHSAAGTSPPPFRVVSSRFHSGLESKQ